MPSGDRLLSEATRHVRGRREHRRLTMKKTRLLALTALLCAGAALPASAQPANAPWDRPGGWDRIGSVDFSFRRDRETEYGSFGGRVERLSFMARNADVRCNRVTATYANGRSTEIFRGRMQQGRSVVVDIPGRSQVIRRIDFNCRSLERREQARVDIAADIGQYRAEWRRSPDWSTRWSRMFNWGNDRVGDNRYGNDRYVSGGLNPDGWVMLSTEVFNGPTDRESTFAGFRGRNVERIALRATNDDARCRRVTATLADGSRHDLNIAEDNYLREDRVYQLDLPGRRTDVMRVDMTCHAVHGQQVTMQVMANR
jgi:hypothetical protein